MTSPDPANSSNLTKALDYVYNKINANKIMWVMSTPRGLNTIGLLLCAGLLVGAMYFQLAMGITPCPLCALQRILYIIAGVIFLIAALHNPKDVGVRIYGSLTFLMCIIGVIVASRQVWLQLYPPADISTCAPGLTYMLNTMPLTETLKVMFTGTGDCAKVHWTFLGFSIAGWSLVFFALLSLLSLRQMFRKLPLEKSLFR